MRFRRRDNLGVPVLAMVDAFVGAVSIVLILTLLSRPAAEATASRPMPDVAVKCLASDRAAMVPGVPEPIDLRDVPIALGKKHNGQMSLRVMIETPAGESGKGIVCANLLQSYLEKANRQRDAQEVSAETPIFLIDIRFVEGEQ